MASLLSEITIDGATLEGGGQVLRSVLSLSFLSNLPVRIHSIRAGRSKPGLANQHLVGARLCAILSSRSLSGDVLGSQEVVAQTLSVEDKSVPFPTELYAKSTTSGATTLILQAVLPPLLFCTDGSTELVLIGATDGNFAPPVAHTQLVLAPLLKRMGVFLELQLKQRAFVPDLGELRVRASLLDRTINPINLTCRGTLINVHVFISSTTEGANAAVFMGTCVELLLKASPAVEGAHISLEVEKPSGVSNKKKPRTQSQLSVQLVASTDTGVLLSVNRLFNTTVVLDEEKLDKEASSIIRELEELVESGACACEHTCDQLIIYMALANGRSRLAAPTVVTSHHLETVIHFAAMMTGARFHVGELLQGTAHRIIECDGVGAQSLHK